jgi:hypothetical protein
MDFRSISKFLHQTKKCIRCFVARKHRLVNKRQGPSAEVQEVANLGGAVLKPDNLSGPFWGSPE